MNYYFVFRDTGVRIWFNPWLWLWRPYGKHVGGRTIYEFGPVTVYKGW